MDRNRASARVKDSPRVDTALRMARRSVDNGRDASHPRGAHGAANETGPPLDDSFLGRILDLEHASHERRDSHKAYVANAPLEELVRRITPRRLARLREVVGTRMSGITVVLEELYDAGNRAAVYRSAEGFGLLDVHVVKPEAARKPRARQVSRGSEKWLRIHEHPSATATCDALRAQGFRIAVSDLTAARPLHTLDFSSQVALVFGNEHAGISDEMRAHADEAFSIPMCGFTQSYNISVAAGITLAHARRAREQSLGAVSDLSPEARAQLFDAYVRQSALWMRRDQRELLGNRGSCE